MYVKYLGSYWYQSDIPHHMAQSFIDNGAGDKAAGAHRYVELCGYDGTIYVPVNKVNPRLSPSELDECECM